MTETIWKENEKSSWQTEKVMINYKSCWWEIITANRIKTWEKLKKLLDKLAIRWYNRKATTPKRWAASIVPCKLNNVNLNELQTWNSFEVLYSERQPEAVNSVYKKQQASLIAEFWLSRTSVRHNTIFREFDPGSGWTLAACLTHASRTEHSYFGFCA